MGWGEDGYKELEEKKKDGAVNKRGLQESLFLMFYNPRGEQPGTTTLKGKLPIQAVRSRYVFVCLLWNISVGSRTHLVNGISLTH